MHSNNGQITSRCLLEYVQSTSITFPLQLIFFGIDFLAVSTIQTTRSVLFVEEDSALIILIEEREKKDRKEKKEAVSIKINFSENKKVGRKQLPSAAPL